MPRRNTIPLPGLPGVSRAGPTAKLDPRDAARPGMAAASMAVTGFQAAANLALKARDTRDAAAREEFNSAVKIYKMSQKDTEDTSFDKFRGDAEQADPRNIMGIYLDHAERSHAAHEQGIEALRSGLGSLNRKDRRQAELLIAELNQEFEGNQQRDFQDAKIMATRRTVEMETNLAKRQYQRNYFPNEEQATNEQILARLEAEEVLKKHIPNEDEFNEVIRDLKVDAEYDFFVTMAQSAETTEQIDGLIEEFDQRKDIFEFGHQRAIKQEIRGAINRRDRIIQGLYHEAEQGRITKEILDFNLAKGIIPDQATYDELLVTNSARLDKDEQKRRLDLFKTSQWSGTDGMRKRLDEMAKLSKDDVAIQTKTFKEMVDHINDRIPEDWASARAWAKQHALGILQEATGELESGTAWYQSDEMGDLIGDIKDEERRNLAANRYLETVGKMRDFLAKHQKDLPIYEQATALETGLASLYRDRMPAEDEVNKKLADVFGSFARDILGQTAQAPNVYIDPEIPEQAIRDLLAAPDTEEAFIEHFGRLPVNYKK